MGVLMIASPRFRYLGEGTEHGSYQERKGKESRQLLQKLDFADKIFPGIV